MKYEKSYDCFKLMKKLKNHVSHLNNQLWVPGPTSRTSVTCSIRLTHQNDQFRKNARILFNLLRETQKDSGLFLDNT